MQLGMIGLGRMGANLVRRCDGARVTSASSTTRRGRGRRAGRGGRGRRDFGRRPRLQDVARRGRCG